MVNDSQAEEEVARLQAMHETVERLRAQLKNLQIEHAGGTSDSPIAQRERLPSAGESNTEPQA